MGTLARRRWCARHRHRRRDVTAVRRLRVPVRHQLLGADRRRRREPDAQRQSIADRRADHRWLAAQFSPACDVDLDRHLLVAKRRAAASARPAPAAPACSTPSRPCCMPKLSPAVEPTRRPTRSGVNIDTDDVRAAVALGQDEGTAPAPAPPTTSPVPSPSPSPSPSPADDSGGGGGALDPAWLLALAFAALLIARAPRTRRH